MSSLAVRRVILTGAVAAITATGAIYGAQLKGAQQALQVSYTEIERMPKHKLTVQSNSKSKEIPITKIGLQCLSREKQNCSQSAPIYRTK
jgi:hypothetical protein